MAFLKALRLLGDEERRYISSLSELRNKLVHDVRQSTFQLATMVSEFDDKALKAFTKTFSPHESRIPNPDFDEALRKGRDAKGRGNDSAARIPLFVEIDPQSMRELIERARKEPKLHLWAGAINVFSSLGDMYWFSDQRQQIKASQILNEDESEI